MMAHDTKFRQRSGVIRAKLRRGGLSIAGRSVQLLLWRLIHGLPQTVLSGPIPRTLFGVNCPPNPDPAWDAVYLRWIRELGVGSVRVDVTYESDTEAFWRWVEALHGAGIDVVAHLVQPAAAAANMHAPRERADWEQFVAAILEPVRDSVSHAELGSTPNRHTWSGLTVSDCVAIHEIARPILHDLGIRSVGPNVSDFAPYFSAALLGALRARGLTPHVHSDNLFVDRSGRPPERPDHRAVGRLLSPLTRLTLVRKIRWLAALSRWAGCEETWITSFGWTIAPGESRKPRYVDEAAQAAYLARYCLLAASTGLVQRVFWGQLAHHLRGLIDDGHPVRHDPPEVFLWRRNQTCPSDSAKRPSFDALRELTQRLVGTRILGVDMDRRACHMHLERDGERWALTWDIDSQQMPSPTS
ncbi:hypothetical protein JXA47_08995 [Candidatus Sumerlaeota bacterium]|nr:hypothetical protein [Candidatus Sumerlaeota bacterium]